jgi:hypothetical protein
MQHQVTWCAALAAGDNRGGPLIRTGWGSLIRIEGAYDCRLRGAAGYVGLHSVHNFVVALHVQHQSRVACLVRSPSYHGWGPGDTSHTLSKLKQYLPRSELVWRRLRLKAPKQTALFSAGSQVRTRNRVRRGAQLNMILLASPVESKKRPFLCSLCDTTTAQWCSKLLKCIISRTSASAPVVPEAAWRLIQRGLELGPSSKPSISRACFLESSQRRLSAAQ